MIVVEEKSGITKVTILYQKGGEGSPPGQSGGPSVFVIPLEVLY